MEGIVLKSIIYGERDRILTLMTPKGMLKLFVKGRRKLDLRRVALTTPFTRGQYLYQVRKSELYRFVDGSIYDQHLPLRDSLEKLSAAQKMVDALLQSQWPNNPSPELYHLFALFLKKTCDVPNLVTPFLIKLMKHEGGLRSDLFSGAEAKRLELIAHTRSMEELHQLDENPTFSEKVEAQFASFIAR